MKGEHTQVQYLGKNKDRKLSAFEKLYKDMAVAPILSECMYHSIVNLVFDDYLLKSFVFKEVNLLCGSKKKKLTTLEEYLQEAICVKASQLEHLKNIPTNSKVVFVDCFESVKQDEISDQNVKYIERFISSVC